MTTKIEPREEYSTQTTRSIHVTEPDVRYPANTMHAFCGFSISSYRDERNREPELRFDPQNSMTRAQWEQAKRLGDLAFDEYAKKWPAPEGGYR